MRNRRLKQMTEDLKKGYDAKNREVIKEDLEKEIGRFKTEIRVK